MLQTPGMWGPSPRAEQHWIGFLAFRSPPRVRFHGLVRKKNSNGLCKLGKICSNFTRVSSSNIDSLRHRFRLNLKRKSRLQNLFVKTKKQNRFTVFSFRHRKALSWAPKGSNSTMASASSELPSSLSSLSSHPVTPGGIPWFLVFRVTVCIGMHRYAGFPYFTVS